MDTIKRPFLFFYTLFLLCFLMGTEIGKAQEATDSLSYYYHAILAPENPSHLPSGIRYYTQKKEQHLIHKDTLEAIIALRMIAIGQFNIGYTYESEGSIVEALHLIDNLQYKDTLIDSRIGLYNLLGIIYRTSKNYNGAIKSFDEALKISKKIKDSLALLNNKANVYKDLQQYELAGDQYAQVYQKSVQENDSLQLAMALDNWGYVQSKINSPNAFENLNKALKIRLMENDLTGLYASYKSLAQFFLDRNDKEQALSYANKAYDVVKKINSASYTQDALSLFMELNRDPKVAEYKRLTDSITEARQLSQNKNAFMKYNLEEEQKKTEASKLQQEKEKRLKLWYQSVAAIILIILIASFIVFQDRYKRGKIEQIHKNGDQDF